MIIHDTITCQPACRGGAGRCLFLQSIYLRQKAGLFWRRGKFWLHRSRRVVLWAQGTFLRTVLPISTCILIPWNAWLPWTRRASDQRKRRSKTCSRKNQRDRVRSASLP